ncbi:MAG: rod shape-determining protein MreC [Patescibacteria group bacterium]
MLEGYRISGKRRVRIWPLAVVIVLALVLQLPFGYSVRDYGRRILTIPTRLLDSLANRLVTATKLVFSISDLARENQTLSIKVNQLQAQVSTLEAAGTENEQLKRELGFQQNSPNGQFQTAQVVSFSPAGFNQSLTINRGSRDSVIVGSAVIAGGYLIGKIATVGDRTAEVWLLTNRNLTTPIVLANSQTIGLLKGGIRGLVIENIPLDTKIEPNEAVVSSSLEGLFPPGLAIGSVEEVISSGEDIFLTLRILAPVKLGNLSVVSVMTNEAGG